MQIVTEAIERSKSHDEIVTLDRSDIGIALGHGKPSGVEAVIDELLYECEDNTESDGVLEFWGKDVDGAEWRVHVVR